ncbi:MAG: HlyD family type I secretion periplasmic adaptor subunit [Desulfobulbaceae bacterium]|nr:HlyD family type I secretion periplasmic adaptor subunit [Desulfobulbaceae bacterium]
MDKDLKNNTDSPEENDKQLTTVESGNENVPAEKKNETQVSASAEKQEISLPEEDEVIDVRTFPSLTSDPKPIIAAGLLVIALFFGGLGVWAAFFPFSGAIIAPGITKVSTERQTIQHLEGGIVDKIYVRDGDHVKPGDILISLKNSMVDSSVTLFQGQLWAKIAEKARLEAEKNSKDSITWPQDLLSRQHNPSVKKSMDDQLDIFLSRKEDLRGKTLLYKSQIEQLNKEIAGLEVDLRAKKEILANLQEEFAAKEELYKERYIDKVQILEIQRRISEIKGISARVEQAIAGNRNKIEEIKLQIADLKNTYKENAVTSLGKTGDEIFALKERLNPLLDSQQRMNITAPVGGIVINLNIHSADGGVVPPRAPILDIVPENAELVIEAKIRLNEITKVHKNQEVMVQLSAFNRRKVPNIPGRVIYISADQTSENTPLGQQSFYQVEVSVDEDELKKNNAYLSPGMPTVCFITTEKRTILEYLLEPILQNLDRSLKES